MKQREMESKVLLQPRVKIANLQINQILKKEDSVLHCRAVSEEGQDEVNVNCLRDNNGRVVVDNEEIKKILKGYMECLLKEEKVWDKQVYCNVKEGPECSVTQEEVGRALKR